MPILLGIVGLLLIALMFGPQIWIRRVLARHSVERPDLPGTGAELARHLLDEADLTDVAVEETHIGDHYDPQARVVRLLPQHHGGRSIAAVAVAAHEVSHAVQHARQEPAFMRRFNLVSQLVWVERAAIGVLLLAPLIFMAFKSPLLAFLPVLASVMLMGIGILVHLLTLPVEFDASFGKALPVLTRGRYLSAGDMPAARRVLQAAAFTYVAAALSTLLNILRWIR
jgi:Zn-dependent membrane protease YugP